MLKNAHNLSIILDKKLMKIIDSFIFNNEFDLLNYRLNLLYPYVDYFIICEAKFTHAGKPKPLHFMENAPMFQKFTDKILHLYINEFPFEYPNINYSENQQWHNEIYHRNSINVGLLRLQLESDDIVIVSDLDEIIKPKKIQQIRDKEIVIDQVYHIEMKLFYYNLNYVANTKWYHPFLCDYKTIQNYNDLSTLRLSDSNKYILDGGWHLSYFGDSQFIKNKLESFAHQEFNNKYYNNDYLIETSIKKGIQFWSNEKLNYVDIEANDDLPDRYQEFLLKFAKEKSTKEYF